MDENFAGFDFAGMNFKNLDFEGFTGSKESASPFSFFEQAQDVASLRAGFQSEMRQLKTGALKQLIESLGELKQTRALAETVFDARLKSLDEDQNTINARLARAKGVPSAVVDPNVFKIAGKLRDTGSERGLPNLVAEAFVKEDDATHVLAKASTDAEGNFELPLEQVKVNEGQEVFVRFRTADQTVLPGAESSLSYRLGSAETLMIGAEVTDRVMPHLEIANSLVAGREASLASLNVRKQAVQAERTTTLQELDGRIGRHEQMIALLEAELPEPDDRPARLLGNSASRELHDLDNITPQCQIDEIRFDHRITFATVNEARSAGYDLCAYCFGRERSQR